MPLVLCNGIGASLEVLDPLVEQLDPDSTVVRFDVPGHRRVAGIGPAALRVSVSGLGAGPRADPSWASAWWMSSGCPGAARLAQQFAFQNPRRCRRLVLVATGTGFAHGARTSHGCWRKMLTPRRFSDPDYAASIAGDLYGGTVRSARRRRRAIVRTPAARRFEGRLPAPAARRFGVDQPVRAARDPATDLDRRRDRRPDHPDDQRAHHGAPAAACDGCTLHPGGHIDLVTNAAELAPVIDTFLRRPLENDHEPAPSTSTPPTSTHYE